MATRTLGEVPTGCRQRLLAHYGPEAQAWLDAAPALLAQAAERWKLAPGDDYDAGHASVIAAATDLDGRPLLLVNGRRDRTTRPAQAERLFAAALEAKTMQWYDGGHWPPPAVVEGAAEWIAARLTEADPM